MRPAVLISAVACVILVSVPATAFAGPEYDVSYLWSHKLDRVYAYRNQVARVLGPRVTKKLKVVRGGKLFGLIYHRRGDVSGAGRTARAHSKLLRSRGLEAAAPIGSMDWTFVNEKGEVSNPRTFRATGHTREQQLEIKDLEAAVARYIENLRRKGKIAPDERTAWSVYDFTTGEQLVSINEDLQLQAASLVKPFFALAFFHQVGRGKFKYGRKSRRNMERMIQHSNNRSTNWIIRQVGGPAAVQRILTQHYAEIFQETRIVEYMPANGRTYRNKASANDYSRFLAALWNAEIPGAREIKRLMRLPGPDRIYTGAREVPQGTWVYNKTGSTSRLCGDMGILVVKGRDGKRYPYILVGVIEKQRSARNYTSWIRSRSNVIRRVSNIVYLGISQQHKLRRSL